jgi:hypothetical protein
MACCVPAAKASGIAIDQHAIFNQALRQEESNRRKQFFIEVKAAISLCDSQSVSY